MSLTAPLVYVVAKRSQYQKHVLDHRDQRAIELLARHDPVVARWRRADDAHRRTLDQVLRELARRGATVRIVGCPSERFSTRDATLVMTVGGDGTLLAASHRVGTQPLLGVNSSPAHSVGYFCAAHPGNLRALIPRALDGSLPHLSLTRMKVVVNHRLRSARVLNEVLFSHRIPAAVSRYILEHAGRREEQRSSGFWIGTAAGSTGAMRSAGGRVLSLGSNRLELIVREPCTPFGATLSLRRLIVAAGEEVIVRTKMDRAVLFLDGPFRRIFLELGDVVRFSASDESLNVLGARALRHKLG
jgi:NAD+ kinase